MWGLSALVSWLRGGWNQRGLKALALFLGRTSKPEAEVGAEQLQAHFPQCTSTHVSPWSLGLNLAFLLLVSRVLLASLKMSLLVCVCVGG